MMLSQSAFLRSRSRSSGFLTTPPGLKLIRREWLWQKILRRMPAFSRCEMFVSDIPAATARISLNSSGRMNVRRGGEKVRGKN